ncbi:L-amino acid N-acyltransferase YncA [Arboricoccus pini]|uniref:L-amino acid N-acyltransferase YncA n=1 Tax=Arboricoccus pini TaxID=1963835 RepID=A0A212RNG2_9PROT|nr:GNAT family N-acetyltransferase [Arboricoccus pini]SNB74071.1 L-amino acid N-acyltransferase YncA [Arboricoccus pini]
MSEIVIRPAVAEDRDALIEQFQLLNQHEDDILHDRRRDREGGEEALDVVLAHVAKTDGLLLVAERTGRVLGHICLTFEEAPVYIRPERRRYAYVKELFLREEARGLGLAQKLLSHVEAIARARGYRQLMISYVAGNELAERAYERFGFETYGIDRLKRLD